MRILRSVIKAAARIAARVEYRHPLKAVKVQRSGNDVTAYASDGRMAVRFEWHDGEEWDPGSGSKALLLASDLVKAEEITRKGLSKRASGYPFLAIDEASLSQVEARAYPGFVLENPSSTATVQTFNGTYPDVESKGILEPRDGTAYVSIALDPELLIRLLQAFDVTREGSGSKVRLEVPLNGNPEEAPIRVYSKGGPDRVDVVGVLMPIQEGGE